MRDKNCIKQKRIQISSFRKHEKNNNKGIQTLDKNGIMNKSITKT